MLKEFEALKKWCPMVRTSGFVNENSGNVTVNTFNSSTESPTCIGSECMMWRWVQDAKVRRRSIETAGGGDEEEPVADRVKYAVPPSWTFVPCEGDPSAWVEPLEEAEARAELERRGFCGLAGYPFPLFTVGVGV